jgi:hypothetical protein
MTGKYAVLPLLLNGRFGVMSLNVKLEDDRVVETLRATSCCSVAEGRKAYAMLLLLVENEGRSIVVGLYGRDWDSTTARRVRAAAQRTVTWFLMMPCRMKVRSDNIETVFLLDHNPIIEYPGTNNSRLPVAFGVP